MSPRRKPSRAGGRLCDPSVQTMKTLLAFSGLIVGVALGNVGCSANASVKKADITKPNVTAQVAYVTAPAK